MREQRLALLLERLEHVRRYYREVNIPTLKEKVSEVGDIAAKFPDVLCVMAVGFPYYSPDNYVPQQLQEWLRGKLGYVLDEGKGLEHQIQRAYDVAREDVDIKIVVGTERDFTGTEYRRLQQESILHGDGKIFDIRGLDRVLRRRVGVGLHAFEEPDNNRLVVDQTIVPSPYWERLRRSPQEWLMKDIWNWLGIDVMFSMTFIAGGKEHDFIDEFRYAVLQSQPGDTPAEKIASLRFPENTPHADLLRDPVVYAHWTMRMLQSYTNHEAKIYKSEARLRG